MMTLGSLPLILAAFLFEGVSWPYPGAGPLLGFLYMVFVSGMLCSWAWNYLVLKLPVAVSSLSSLLTPLIGVAGGIAILGEKPGFPEFLGAAFILGAGLPADKTMAPRQGMSGFFFRRSLGLKRRQGAPLASRTASAGRRALLKFMTRQA
jgi:hypothetical protein